MPDFSSLKFSKFYLNGETPGRCKLYMLQLTEASMVIFKAVDDCINLINYNRGFIIVGWYKIGHIADKRMISTARPVRGVSDKKISHN